MSAYDDLLAARAALVLALARGVKRVTQDGQTLEYGSADEMQTALNVIDSELATLGGQPRRSAISLTTVLPRRGYLQW